MGKQSAVEVVHFQRKPDVGHYALENFAASIREHVSDAVRVRLEVCPHLSCGVMPRAKSVLHARRRQGDVNHITGDVHFLALGLEKRRTILSINDCVPLPRLRGLKRWVARLFWFRLPVRHAAVITTISEATRDELMQHIRGVSKEAIRVIYISIDPQFEPDPKEFPGGKVRILQMGAMPNKNVVRLCQALEGIDCVLDIVGKLDAATTEALEKHGICYEASHHLSDGEVREKYRQCDMVSFVSTYEGFGMPIVEANTVERPVVTSTVCSMPEVAGDAACLVDPYDVEAIRAGFLRVINDADYRNALIEAGRKNRLRFSPDRIARQYEELYLEVAAGL